MKQTHRSFRATFAAVVTLIPLACLASIGAGRPASNLLVQDRSSDTLTPRQAEIARQQQRLNSTDTEERRDALMRLGAQRHPDASRACLPALNDAQPIIRVTAARAILALPGDESARALLPLLADKDPFVRREVAYDLGMTRSRAAVAPLIETLTSDKVDEVRSAAAIALGDIRDESAVVALSEVLSAGASDKKKRERNPFVLRAAATALGRIGSRAGVPALVNLLSDERFPNDVRREAAQALGLIGDSTAVPALQSASLASDPYLARAAANALRRIANTETRRPS